MAPTRRAVPARADAIRAGGIGLAAVTAVALSVVTSGTRPFTLAADVVTALPLVVAAVAVGLVLHRRRGVGDGIAVGAGGGGETGRLGYGVLAWAAVVVVVVGFELFNLFHAARNAHPTLSALLDEFDAGRWGRGATFLVWLVLGAYLVLA